MRVFIAVLTSALLSSTVACGGGDDDSNGAGGTGGGSAACEQGCVDTLAADCPLGPPDQATCVSSCRAQATGVCKTEYAALQSCAEGKPITCDDDSGIPVVEACSTEQNAFIACVN